MALKGWRKNNLERANYKCEICGTSGVFLHIHHMVQFSSIVESFAKILNLDLKTVEYMSDDYLKLEKMVLEYHFTHNIGIVVCECCHDNIDINFHKQTKMNTYAIRKLNGEYINVKDKKDN